MRHTSPLSRPESQENIITRIQKRKMIRTPSCFKWDGDSPYQPLSAFAVNAMLVGMEPLVRLGLLGSLPIVAEDLGGIRPEVDALRLNHSIPGIFVLQFEKGRRILTSRPWMKTASATPARPRPSIWT